jgi:hypothetical protein
MKAYYHPSLRRFENIDGWMDRWMDGTVLDNHPLDEFDSLAGEYTWQLEENVSVNPSCCVTIVHRQPIADIVSSRCRQVQ